MLHCLMVNIKQPQFYSLRQASEHIGIRFDSLKEAAQKGIYEHIIGPLASTGQGKGRRYQMTPGQINRLKTHLHEKDRVVLRILAMGGGIQTTALMLMALEGILNPAPDGTMFIDLGWESSKTYENLRQLQRMAEAKGHPFKWVKGESIFEDLLAASFGQKMARTPPFFLKNQHGKRAQIGRDCTSHYKAERMAHEIRKMLGYPAGKTVSGRVEVMLGISTDEAHRLNNNSKYTWIDNRFPLIDLNMSREDCEAFIASRNFEIPPKSACLGCPYRPNAEWKEMKENRPEEFKQVVFIDNAIRRGINKIKDPLFIHQTLKPISEVDFDGSRKDGFGNDCSGMCAT